MHKPISDDVLKRTYMASANISMGILLAVAVVELIMLLATVFNAPFYGEYLFKFRTSYFSMLLLAVLYEVLMLYVKGDFDSRFRILELANPFCGFFFFVWSIGVTYNEALLSGSVSLTIYMTFAISVPLCFYMSPLIYTLLAIASDFLMIYVTFYFSGTLFTISKLVILLVFQIMLGVSLLDLKRNLSLRLSQAEEQKNEIRDLSSAQTRFFSSMSHEIRTPINSIIGLDEMILREDASEVINEDARHILSSSRLLLHLINDLLDLSKISAGMFELIEAPYYTKDAFSEVWSILGIQAAQKGIDLKMDIDPGIPKVVSGDVVRIQQILVNLLYNAIKYTDKGTVILKISCTVSNAKDAVFTYTVSDTGIGIKEEYIPYLFTAYRLNDNEEVKRIEGNGFGLSVVKQFLDHMGGTIAVESEFGKGSTFVVTLPQEVVDITPIGEFDPYVRRSGYEKYKGRLYAPDISILVVDDTPENLFVARRLLANTHMQIDTAQGGKQALMMTAMNKYDIILLDHFMPEMDGIETLHAIKDQPDGLCHTSKFVMLTANVSSGVEKLYADEGFDAHMTKPVTSREMEDVLVRLLGDDDRIEFKSHDRSVGERESLSDEVPEALIRIYLSSIDETADQLDAYLNAGDLDNYTIKVHGLKSSARLVREKHISEQASKLEEAGNQGDIEAIRRMHPFFIREYRESKDHLGSFRNSASLVTDSELRDAYLTISEFARSEDYSGVQAILRSLEQYDLKGTDSVIISQIKKAMDAMDYQTTCSIIEKIL